MGVLDFQGRQAATAWQGRVEALNTRAKSVMDGVTEVIEHINVESKGQMVDELVQTGSEMVVATDKMVSAFKELYSAVTSILNILQNAAQSAIEFVTGRRGKMTR